MNVTHDMSVLSLVTGASLLVQLVMAGLLLASVFSWYYIFIKIFTYKRAVLQADRFEKEFWSGADLNALPSGVYFLRMDAGAFGETRQLVLIR